MQKHHNIILVILIAALLIVGAKYKSLKSENENLTSLVDEYDYSLSQANDNIEEANSYIEDAQGYAWSSYEDMGYALESMDIVDTVSAP
jgi:archaellum component FlaF (FlaF/FlaG flagellin family)